MKRQIVLATICLLLSVVFSFADSLPSDFLGNWESLPLPEPSENPEYLKLSCREHEGVTITRKNIVSNTVGGCDIDNVKQNPSGETANISVSLTCYTEENLRMKSVEVWS